MRAVANDVVSVLVVAVFVWLVVASWFVALWAREAYRAARERRFRAERISDAAEDAMWRSVVASRR